MYTGLGTKHDNVKVEECLVSPDILIDQIYLKITVISVAETSFVMKSYKNQILKVFSMSLHIYIK